MFRIWYRKQQCGSCRASDSLANEFSRCFLVISGLFYLLFFGWLNLSWNESLWTEPHAPEKGRLSNLIHGQPYMHDSIDVLSIFGQLERYWSNMYVHNNLAARTPHRVACFSQITYCNAGTHCEISQEMASLWPFPFPFQAVRPAPLCHHLFSGLAV